jgi:pimeloyl-ACP methyl ester carboxylesterase
MPEAAINGTTLYYEEHGQGTPLVMIQGYMGDHSAWVIQVKAFSKYFRVITYDARGLGKTPVSPIPFTIPVQAGDAIGLMDFLKIDRAHILGISLGGLVAQAIAIEHPERVMKLVLAATLPGTDTQYASEKAQVLARNLYTMDMDKVGNLMIPLAFNNPAVAYMAKLFSRTPWASRYKTYVKQMQSVGSYYTVDRLHQIQAPTLVIAGSRDRIISPRSSEIIAAKIPNARLVLVKGGSHAFFMEMSRRFNREVLQFLQSESTRAATSPS